MSFVIMSFPKRLPNDDATTKFSDSIDERNHRRLQPLLTNDRCCAINGGERTIHRTLNNNEFDEKQMLMNKLPPSTASFNSIDYGQMPVEKIVTAKPSKSALQNRSFLATINRLIRNRILVCRIASTVLHILPISGFYTFLPKYLENQFRLTASDASFISGIAGILVMGIGIFSSGIVMRKFNPNPRLVSRWIAIATFIYAVGMLSLTTIGCSQSEIVSSNSFISVSASINHNQTRSCLDCNCADGQFAPICSSSGITYVSPCVAGCTRQSEHNSSVRVSSSRRFSYFDST